MMIKRRANCLVKRLGDGAFYLTKLCFVHGLFTDVVCSNPGYGLSAFNSTAWDEKKKKKKKKKKNKELYFGSNGTDEDDAGPACSGS